MRATFDVGAGTCDLIVGDVLLGVQDLFFSFRDNGSLPVFFDGLSFGWETSTDGKIVASGSFPLSSEQRYVASYEDYSEVETLYFLPSTVYTLRVWAKNADQDIEASETFETGPPVDYEAIAEAMAGIEPLEDE